MDVELSPVALDLESMLAQVIPCGGVLGLGIPPCGAAADFVLDHGNLSHPCRVMNVPANFKCTQCYQLWLDAIATGMAAAGGVVGCGRCKSYFNNLSDFARYVPL